MSLRARLLFISIVAAAGISMLAAVAFGPDAAGDRLGLAVGLGLFAIAAELLVYAMPHGGQGSIALIPLMALVLVSPSWQAIVVAAGSETFVQLLRRRALPKAIYNTAQSVLALSLATLVYVSLGGYAFTEDRSFGDTVVHNAIPAIACLGVIAITNSCAISGIVAATQDLKFWDVWKRSTLGTASYYLLAWPFAGGLAWVYAQHGPVAAVALAIPMIGVRQLYQTTLRLQQTNRELLELMVKAIEARDPYTSGHSRRVSESATIIARGLGLSAAKVDRVRIAALLHDIGKIHEDFAPILRKDSKLTPEEWEVMKTHPDKGADLIATLSDLRDIVDAIRHHHENWNGTGYPSGIAGETIPLAARIITFADTIDALTTDRPYRRALTEAQVRDEMVRCRALQFDPTICDVVLSQTMWRQLFPSAQSTPTRLTLVDPQPIKRVARA